jgi:hypothetical protein
MTEMADELRNRADVAALAKEPVNLDVAEAKVLANLIDQQDNALRRYVGDLTRAEQTIHRLEVVALLTRHYALSSVYLAGANDTQDYLRNYIDHANCAALGWPSIPEVGKFLTEKGYLNIEGRIARAITQGEKVRHVS